MMLPREETYTSTKKELLERITGLLGGRVAEEIVYNEVSTGAHNDFEKAMRLLGRRHNICIQDYVCMSIADIAKRLTEEGKTGNMLALEPIRFSEAD